MRKFFRLTTWGNPSIMSDYKIHKQIMEESKISNSDWLASASELVDVCNKKGFDKDYAIDIKCAIVNCFASLIRHGDLHVDVANDKGVFTAFNDLLTEYSKNKHKTDYNVKKIERIKDVCANFLNSYIYRITFWQYLSIDSDSFYKAYHEYRENKIKELMTTGFVEFRTLEHQISEEYKNYINEKISNGSIKVEPRSFKVVNTSAEIDNLGFKDEKNRQKVNVIKRKK